MTDKDEIVAAINTAEERGEKATALVSAEVGKVATSVQRLADRTADWQRSTERELGKLDGHVEALRNHRARAPGDGRYIAGLHVQPSAEPTSPGKWAAIGSICIAIVALLGTLLRWLLGLGPS